MACRTTDLGGGIFAVTCTRGPRGQLASCAAPGCRRPCVALCDWPVTKDGKTGTCSAQCCDTHRKRVSKNEDWCLPHAKLSESLKPAGATTATGTERPQGSPTLSAGTDPTGGPAAPSSTGGGGAGGAGR
jgi:hypothetical protein